MLKAAVVAVGLVVFSCVGFYAVPTVAQGAISQAIELRHVQESLKKYQEELFIDFALISREEFLLFLDRVEKNQELKGAILRAKNAGIVTFAGRSSHVISATGISLNVFDDDAAIISFLLGR